MSFSRGYFSISQRRGLITLLLKKNKPRQFLKNWRPTLYHLVTVPVKGIAAPTRLEMRVVCV